MYTGRITGVLPHRREFEFVDEVGNKMWGHVSDEIDIWSLYKYIVNKQVVVCQIEGELTNLLLTKVEEA